MMLPGECGLGVLTRGCCSLCPLENWGGRSVLVS